VLAKSKASTGGFASRIGAEDQEWRSIKRRGEIPKEIELPGKEGISSTSRYRGNYSNKHLGAEAEGEGNRDYEKKGKPGRKGTLFF